MLDALVLYWLSFLVYSIFGWAFEEVFCSIGERRVVNRGFLNGPYCPIYGAGALAAYVLLANLVQLHNPLAIFAISGVVCCAIEYATSYILERHFHARWWDYSNRFLNLNGRICLAGGTLFGIACTLVVLFVQPLLFTLLGSVPVVMLYVLAGISFGIFVFDIVFTNIGLSGFRTKVDEICEQLTARSTELYATLLESDGPLAQQVERLQSSKAADAYARLRNLAPDPVAIEDLLQPYLQTFTEHLNNQERRVLNAFPGLRIGNSRELVQALRSRIRNKR